MHNLVLPPKRWEDAEHPKFDPIRGRKWFPRLLKRKKHIPLLERAMEDCSCSESMTQEECAEAWGVDSREMRDFVAFRKNTPSAITELQQSLLDEAYVDYLLEQGSESFTDYIQFAARRRGLNPRPIKELWEVAPNFYPSNYAQPD